MKNSFDSRDEYENDILGMDAFLFSDPVDWADDGYGRTGLDDFGYDDFEQGTYDNEDYDEGDYDEDFE